MVFRKAIYTRILFALEKAASETDEHTEPLLLDQESARKIRNDIYAIQNYVRGAYDEEKYTMQANCIRTAETLIKMWECSNAKKLPADAKKWIQEAKNLLLAEKRYQENLAKRRMERYNKKKEVIPCIASKCPKTKTNGYSRQPQSKPKR